MKENVFYLNNIPAKQNNHDLKKCLRKKVLIRFEAGIIGFELCRNFILQPAYGGILSNIGECMLLESVELENVKFVVIKTDNDTKFTNESDVISIAEHLNTTMESLMFLYIVTFAKSGCTLNTRAPLIVDKNSKEGWQFILSDEYEIKHKI